MAVKKTIDLSGMKELIPKIRRDVAKKAPGPLKIAILKSILRGISPVKGQRKFQKYSNSYKSQIRKGQLPAPKNISPVNLKLSGVLLGSFFIKPRVRKGQKLVLEIGFEDFLAEIHNNKGAGKSKVIRRILPTESGETFNPRIISTITKLFARSVKKFAREFNRR